MHCMWNNYPHLFLIDNYIKDSIYNVYVLCSGNRGLWKLDQNHGVWLWENCRHITERCFIQVIHRDESGYVWSYLMASYWLSTLGTNVNRICDYVEYNKRVHLLPHGLGCQYKCTWKTNDTHSTDVYHVWNW